MKYKQLIYKSKAAPDLRPDAIVEIVRVAQSSNLKKRVSGLLVHTNGVFVQLIEGSPSVVDGLFERISKDPRHVDIEILGSFDTDKVAMPTWAMAYFSSDLPGSSKSSMPFILSELSTRQICGRLPSNVAVLFHGVLNNG